MEPYRRVHGHIGPRMSTHEHGPGAGQQWPMWDYRRFCFCCALLVPFAYISSLWAGNGEAASLALNASRFLRVRGHPSDLGFGCRKPLYERSLNTIVHALFNEGLIPEGDVLDVGAMDGDWACLYACLQPQRIVRAMDPSAEYVQRIKQRCKHANVRAYLGAVSDRSGRIQNNNKFYVGSLQVNESGNVPLRTVDGMFAEWGTRLGFAHLDVENYEYNAVLGGQVVIQRDRPVLTTEIHLGRASSFKMEPTLFHDSAASGALDGLTESRRTGARLGTRDASEEPRTPPGVSVCPLQDTIKPLSLA